MQSQSETIEEKLERATQAASTLVGAGERYVAGAVEHNVQGQQDEDSLVSVGRILARLAYNRAFSRRAGNVGVTRPNKDQLKKKRKMAKASRKRNRS